MSYEVLYQITNFLNHEAYLLDHRYYEEWLDLLTNDLQYKMPVRVTVEGRGSSLSEDASYFDETKKALTTRVKRLYTKSAWVENSGSRQRHFISNVTILANPQPDEYKVRSYFMFKRSRGSDIPEELFGERVDVLRKVDGEWKIASRTIYPDQAVLGVMNLSMFL